MKKYMRPSLAVVNVENNSILAASTLGVNRSSNSYGTSDFGGRNGRGSYDDEDEEEEW